MATEQFSAMLVKRTKPILALLCVAIMGLSSCTASRNSSGSESENEGPVGNAALPTKVPRYKEIEQALYCVGRTGELKGVTFIVGPFADSTGKINAVASGATGNFVPQGGSAAYITEAITLAGGRVVSTYFGQPAVKVPASYAINGIFNSLDFGAPYSADLRVAGVGPVVEVVGRRSV